MLRLWPDARRSAAGRSRSRLLLTSSKRAREPRHRRASPRSPRRQRDRQPPSRRKATAASAAPGQVAPTRRSAAPTRRSSTPAAAPASGQIVRRLGDFSGRTSRFEGKWSPTSFVASIDDSFLFSCLNAELRSGTAKLCQEQVRPGQPAQLRAGLVPADARLLRGGALSSARPN
mgnify:CR=1 FL=1